MGWVCTISEQVQGALGSAGGKIKSSPDRTEFINKNIQHPPTTVESAPSSLRVAGGYKSTSRTHHDRRHHDFNTPPLWCAVAISSNPYPNK